jgi:hypothetical protein
MTNLIIRNNKRKDLILSCNAEMVYFLFWHKCMIFNSLDYNLISDEFNRIEEEN